MTNSHSSDSDLKKAIESQNPFDRSLIVRSHDVWEQSFPDVPSINSHASDAVFQAIGQIRAGQRSVIGITIKAEKGLGKSHLISRIRSRLLMEGDCFFAYMSEVDYGDLNRINSNFLNTLTSSLKQPGNQGVMQWQELATALVNGATNKDYTPQHLISRFPGALAQNSGLVDSLAERILQVKPNVENPYLIQAILWTLSSDKQSFAINWLAGRELAQKQADVMGLPNNREEDKESQSFQTACQILDLIGDYRTLVIGFDELESVNRNEAGFTRAQAIALLAKDLYSKIKRGVLMLAMYDETYSLQIRALPQAEAVTARIGEKTFDLKYLNSDDVVTLVSCWLKDYYDKKGLTPPHPVYPFDENELRELGKEKPIVRKVLDECKKNWKVPGDGVIVKQTDPVEAAFNKELTGLNRTINDYFEDSSAISDALRLAFEAIKGQTIEGVQIQSIEEVKVKSADKGYLHFRIVGKENGKVVKIVVAVVQESGGRFVSAALKRLIDYRNFDMTRGCLVRSKEVNPNIMGKQHLDKLLSKELGGEFVKLRIEDIKPLLAISFVSKSSGDYELNKEEIKQFILQKKIANDNYLIQEILSDPSGQVPDGLINEEDKVAENKTSATSTTSNKNIEMSLDDLLNKIGR
ncbi:hypothetical protein [Floridanema aerugineum]|jgi:hypothetical protein|uniref:KAP NTPase domain-containing protein n=1 Tax=Floridaenema aerugineum BLCC-F46 TaxID=3153654 RepID=A0ABV4XAB4_9CYAN